MFDAGAIQAHLDVDLATFNRKLDAAEARVKRFEDARHEIKLSAVFDTASMGTARRLFTQLDQQLSRDAMQRLRSSPQGSVLGALSALLSPHGMVGAPSASQMASGPIGRAISGTGGGPGIGSVLLNQAGAGGGAANANAARASASAAVAAQQAAKAATATQTAAQATARAADDTSSSSRSMMGALRALTGTIAASRAVGAVQGIGARIGGAGAIRDLFGGGGGGGGGGGTGPGGWARGIAGGAGPNMPGVPFNFLSRGGAIGGAVALGGAALPALVGGVAPLAVGGLGVGAAGMLFKQAASPALGLVSQQSQAQQALAAAVTPAQKQAAQAQLQSVNQQLAGLAPAQRSLFDTISKLQTMWQNFAQGFAPMFAKAIAPLPGLFHSLMPLLTSFFGSAIGLLQPFILGLTDLAKTVLPLLAQGFRLAAPFIRPLLDGIGKLAGGLLQGLNVLLKAAAPAVSALVDVLGTLGKDLGSFFADMAPALSASGIVLKALFDVIGALLPIIAQLAGVFAKALAPVIVDFAGVIKALMPTLLILGRVLAAMAGAVLADLASMLGAVAKVIVGISPALAVFANAFAQVFTVLENNGVFATLGNVIEQLAGPLAKLISLLLIQLTPLLPVIIALISKLSTIMLDLLAAGLTTIISAVVILLTKMPFLVPLIAGITLAWLAWNLVMSANPIGAIIIAIVALIGGITLLATHWHQVWTDIKNWAMDAWNFITHGWGQWLVPGLTAIRLAVQFVRDHWHQAWQDMKNWAADFWNWLDQVFGHDIGGFFTQTLPGWFKTAVDGIKSFWGKVEDAVKAPVQFVIDKVLDGLISVFDDITNAVGLGKPITQVHPMGLAAGGRIPGFGGGDRWPALLESGEAVVPKHLAATPAFIQWATMMGIPGYAAGGRPVGQAAPGGGGGNPISSLWHHVTHAVGTVVHKAIDAGKMALAFATGNATAFTNAFADILGLGTGGAAAGHLLSKILIQMPKMLVKDLVNWILGQGGGGASGQAIVDYAMRFIGKIPYVWGGTAVPGGADCSGFVTGVYEHFGIHPPRTSEAQYAWVKKGPPTPGGLAFYVSAAGGPPPGHVAIVRTAQQVISQGGGMGPQLMGINAMQLMGTGTPPGGLGGAAGKVTAGVAQWIPLIKQALAMESLPASYLGYVENQMQSESGGNEAAVNNWDINAQMGTPSKGLMQVIDPTFRMWHWPGTSWNIFDPLANIAAALNYAQHGKGFGTGPGQLGSMHGYARGGVIREPVIGFGTTTGDQYRIAENEAELITPASRAGGSAIGNVFITLPEGQTVAKALSDLTFWLRVAQQQNYVGVMPGG